MLVGFPMWMFRTQCNNNIKISPPVNASVQGKRSVKWERSEEFGANPLQGTNVSSVSGGISRIGMLNPTFPVLCSRACLAAEPMISTLEVRCRQSSNLCALRLPSFAICRRYWSGATESPTLATWVSSQYYTTRIRRDPPWRLAKASRLQTPSRCFIIIHHASFGTGSRFPSSNDVPVT